MFQTGKGRYHSGTFSNMLVMFGIFCDSVLSWVAAQWIKLGMSLLLLQCISTFQLTFKDFVFQDCKDNNWFCLRAELRWYNHQSCCCNSCLCPDFWGKLAFVWDYYFHDILFFGPNFHDIFRFTFNFQLSLVPFS